MGDLLVTVYALGKEEVKLIVVISKAKERVKGGKSGKGSKVHHDNVGVRLQIIVKVYYCY